MKAPIISGIISICFLGMVGCTGQPQPAAPSSAPVAPAVAAPESPDAGATATPEWRDAFSVTAAALRPEGDNPYFPLRPGRVMKYAGTEDGERVELVITVTDKTEVIDGVTTRVVEERESKDGELVEVSRNWFAVDPATNDLYYFGEEVDMYRNGRIAGHEGAWRSGVDGARFGLLLPGTPRPGDRYYQEVAPGVALDRAEVLSLAETLVTPAGSFTNCLRTEETSGLKADERGYKTYAPGVGLLKDGALLLQSVPR